MSGEERDEWGEFSLSSGRSSEWAEDEQEASFGKACVSETAVGGVVLEGTRDDVDKDGRRT